MRSRSRLKAMRVSLRMIESLTVGEFCGVAAGGRGARGLVRLVVESGVEVFEAGFQLIVRGRQVAERFCAGPLFQFVLESGAALDEQRQRLLQIGAKG